MERKFNTNAQGYTWSEDTITAVWKKARTISGTNPDVIRLDSCGAVIERKNYGKTECITGWEIDHICPVTGGGNDSMQNLQPLQWQNNRTKGDNVSDNEYCMISALSV